VTIQNLVFDTASAAAYTIGSGGVGAQTLGIRSNGSFASTTLTATAGNDQNINANILLGINGDFSAVIYFRNNSTHTLTLSGNMSGSSGGSFRNPIFDGSGNVLVNGGISMGGATTMKVDQVGTGNTTLAGVSSYNGPLNVGSGNLTLSGSLTGNNTIAVSSLGTTGVRLIEIWIFVRHSQ
jgi:hypothetical protein